MDAVVTVVLAIALVEESMRYLESPRAHQKKPRCSAELVAGCMMAEILKMFAELTVANLQVAPQTVAVNV